MLIKAKSKIFLPSSYFEGKRIGVLKYFLILDIKRMIWWSSCQVWFRNTLKKGIFSVAIFSWHMIYVSAMFTSSSEYDNMCRMFLITVQLRKISQWLLQPVSCILHKSLHYLEQRYQKQRTRKCFLFFAILKIFYFFYCDHCILHSFLKALM